MMPTETSAIAATEKLYSLFETKLHLLREMQQLALEQSDLVAQHDMTGLMSLLSRKQQLMESLQSVQTELLPYRDDDPEQRIWQSQERRVHCQALVVQCDRLLSQLIVQENQSIDHMNVRRDGLQSQLQQNAAASQIQRAYTSDLQSDAESGGFFVLEG